MHRFCSIIYQKLQPLRCTLVYAPQVSSTRRRSLASCSPATVTRPLFPLAKSFCTLALPPSTLALPPSSLALPPSSLALPPSTTLSQGAGQAVPPPMSPPSTPRRHKLVPMKHRENMLDMPVDDARLEAVCSEPTIPPWMAPHTSPSLPSTATMDTPTKAVTFTEVHHSGPSRQQINHRLANKVLCHCLECVLCSLLCAAVRKHNTTASLQGV